ncbi:MAG TPA: prolipoprotein diacylglyceryl transferase [Anaerolineae bacterium]|nr:prolipoprotein diacylglyceryl transferase [Anaerolineae bacterium]
MKGISPSVLSSHQFPLVLGFGVFIGLFGVVRLAKNPMQALDMAIFILFGSLIGGRAGYVWVAWEHFKGNIIEGFKIWEGGFTWYGALCGGLMMMVLVSFLFDVSFWNLADTMIPLLGAISVSIWFGCWLCGIAYGSKTSAWWGIPTIDEYGVISKRLPVQGLGVLFTIISFWIVEFLQHRSEWLVQPGRSFSIVLGTVAGIVLGFSFLFADPSPGLGAFRVDTWASGFIVLLALLFLISTFFNKEANIPIKETD